MKLFNKKSKELEIIEPAPAKEIKAIDDLIAKEIKRVASGSGKISNELIRLSKEKLKLQISQEQENDN